MAGWREWGSLINTVHPPHAGPRCLHKFQAPLQEENVSGALLGVACGETTTGTWGGGVRRGHH